MKRAIATTLALLVLGCGSSDPSTDGGGTPKSGSGSGAENEAPFISGVEMVPEAPGSDDTISLAIAVSDSDRDRLDLSVEWYRNDVRDEELTETSVEAGAFVRGDRVYAIVSASDGSHEVTAESATIVISNAAPHVSNVRLSPQGASALDMILVEAEVVDADGDPTELSYRWAINGEAVAEATTARLAPGLAKRGDKLSVSVSATDGSDAGEWTGSPILVLANAPPKITTQPNYDLAGKGRAEYRYAVAAEDPDGDSPLRYELRSSPPGMSVDVVGGVVSWRVPSDAGGTYPIELVVSDPYGGTTTQSYSLSVNWSDEAPAASAEPSPEKSAPATEAAPAKPAPVPAKRAVKPKAAATDYGSDNEALEVQPRVVDDAASDESESDEGDSDDESSGDEGEDFSVVLAAHA